MTYHAKRHFVPKVAILILLMSSLHVDIYYWEKSIITQALITNPGGDNVVLIWNLIESDDDQINLDVTG